MRYEDRNLQDVIYPYTLNPQMRSVLLPRYLEIEQEFHDRQTEISRSPANGLADSRYEVMEPHMTPAPVLDALASLASLEAQMKVLRDSLEAAGYATHSTTARPLRIRTKDEQEAAQKASNAAYEANSKRRETRLNSLRSIAKRMQGQVMAAVRVKVAQDILVDLDAI